MSGARLRRALAKLLALGAVALLALGVLAWSQLFQPHQAFPESERRVTVESGWSARQILAELERQGVLANALFARLYLVHILGDPPLRAGQYLFTGAATAPEVLAKLAAGNREGREVTLVEGLSMMEVAEQLAAAGFGSAPELLAVMADPAPIADLDPAATHLEGYLFPDTYTFSPAASPREVVGTLVANFRARHRAQLAPLLEDPRARPLREVVTLASIVEKEAKLEAERPLIAGVYDNRLRQGIGLYADPTIIYALRLAGRWNGNLTKADLAMDSPYNTYRVQGLPPSPIASPGLASLLAASDPATVPYLYFVSRNDGSHVFATTLAEHNRNVEQWQRRYFRERARLDAETR
jgi:UPF0755 protein